MKHLSLRIYGRVQGVFFRAIAKRMAESFGITGIACNENDGTVSVEAEGDDSQLQKFVQWCHKGPMAANVTKVTITEGPVEGYKDFAIRYS